MDVKLPLFYSETVCLAPIDPERDAEIESRWTHDAGYLRLLSIEPARPLSPVQVRKKYEELEKSLEEEKNQFYFAVRMRSDDRLVGFARIYWIWWQHRSGMVNLGIGDPGDRQHGYGTQALRLLLGYAFDELNLVRLTAVVSEYNRAALRLFERAGFVQEVRRREAIHRDGRRWDALHLGLLASEWKGNTR
jgi:RimJ/RimL family protein N-acetyltransferase